MVKVLGINGSPRKYGSVSILLRLALKGAEEEGADTKLIHLYEYDIKPCLGCLSDVQESCKYPCVIDDDMRKLYDLILESDALIIGTPIYWYAPSGHLKSFIDRLTVFENMVFVDGTCWTEGKVVGFIVAGNDSGGVNTFSTLMAQFNSMGFVIPPWASAVFNKPSEELLNSESVLLDAYNVGRIVVLMANRVKGLERKWFKPLEMKELAPLVDEIKSAVEKEKNKQWPTRKKQLNL